MYVYYCLFVPILYPHNTITAKWKGVIMANRKKPDKSVERIFFTFTEAQEFLGISHQTLYKLMDKGLPSHKIGKKRVFLKEDLIKWIKDH